MVPVQQVTIDVTDFEWAQHSSTVVYFIEDNILVVEGVEFCADPTKVKITKTFYVNMFDQRLTDVEFTITNNNKREV